ncbi:hypothetical protein WDW37_17155 [Bdellovibrionota bacterium FG-1]
MRKIAATLLLLVAFGCSTMFVTHSPEENTESLRKLVTSGNRAEIEKYLKDNQSYIDRSCGASCGVAVQLTNNISYGSDEFLNEYDRNIRSVEQSLETCGKYKGSITEEYLNCLLKVELGKIGDQNYFARTCALEGKVESGGGCQVIKARVEGTSSYKYDLQYEGQIAQQAWLSNALKGKYLDAIKVAVNNANAASNQRGVDDKKANDEWEYNQKECRKAGLSRAVYAQIRVEQKISAEAMEARLIAVNGYVCGEMQEITKVLPKVFVLLGASTVKQDNCATVYMNHAGFLRQTNRQGFAVEAPTWKVLSPAEVKLIPASARKSRAGTLLESSEWSYCQPFP